MCKHNINIIIYFTYTLNYPHTILKINMSDICVTNLIRQYTLALFVNLDKLKPNGLKEI